MIQPMSKVFVLRDDINVKMMLAFVKNNWRAMAIAGKPIAVAVSEYKARRSNAANRAYWALLRDIAQSAWVGGRRYDEETLHEFFKRELIGIEEIDLPNGQRITRGISSASLSVPEMSEYIDRVQQYAAETFGMEMENAL